MSRPDRFKELALAGMLAFAAACGPDAGPSHTGGAETLPSTDPSDTADRRAGRPGYPGGAELAPGTLPRDMASDRAPRLPVPLAPDAKVGGLDVSHFQGDVDWTAVAGTGRFAFAYVKATEGIDALDAAFATNWRGAGDVGLLRGAYHFFEPQDDPVEQARFFLSTVGPLGPGDLPPVLDVELSRDVDAATILSGARTWLETVEATTGRRPILYTGVNFWNSLASTDFGDYRLWLASYEPEPVLPAGWSDWTFWQYYDRGEVPGIEKEVDLNHYGGSLEDLLKLADLGPPKPDPSPRRR